MIEIKNLTLSYGTTNIFNDLNLKINDGEIIGVIGPSGVGKSTLLKVITALEKADSGTVLLDGVEINSKSIADKNLRGKIGMVFQNFNLFPHMSVIENVMAGPMGTKKYDKTTCYKKAVELLKFVGLSEKSLALPKSLSGGQQQRVAIARTLAMDPKIILMDEPTSALDPLNKGEVETVIRMMAEQKHTMVIVSHEMELIRNVCSKVIFLNNGKVFEEGTPNEIFDSPKHKETRRFIQALRVLELQIDYSDFDFIGLQTTLNEYAYRTGMAVTLLIKLQSVLEELSHVIIIDSKEQNKMNVSIEYNSKSKTLDGTVYCSGEKIDTDDPLFFIPWRIILSRCKSIKITDANKNEYTNLIKFELE